MSVAILWFRKCLRIHDNQTLSWAFESNQIKSILPIYIFEEDIDQGSTTKMNEMLSLILEGKPWLWES